MLRELTAFGVSLLMLQSAVAIDLCSGTISSDNATYDDQDIVICGTVAINGSHPFSSLTVRPNGTLTHTANTGSSSHGLDLAIAGDVAIEAGGRIDVSGRGYPGGYGPGAGGSSTVGGSGAGYGGWGSGSNAGAPYGSWAEPAELGSGGGRDSDNAASSGGSGGGRIRISIGGALTVNGSILANGANGQSQGGGGSGGSIWITAESCEGMGVILAKGGNGSYGMYGSGCGGGGGRIWLSAETCSISGSVAANGGLITPQSTGGSGSAGTVVVGPTGAPSLIIDNDGRQASTTDLNGVIAVGSLIVRRGGIISHTEGVDGFHLCVSGDATIDADGRIDLIGRGYPESTGPGTVPGSSSYVGGAGHGGAGGADGGEGVYRVAGGTCYGAFTEPKELGSGGGAIGGSSSKTGFPGGGAIKVTVGGILSVEGTISADGGAHVGSGGGGGAGGSIWLVVHRLTGSGSITARGGNSFHGGGGGGRIAVYAGSSLFSGLLTASGGYGAAGVTRSGGGAGTIYLDIIGHERPTLILDNGGMEGAATEFNDFHMLNTDLRIRNQASVGHRPGFAGTHLMVNGDVTVEAGGRIDVDGCGYPSGMGPGASALNGRGGGYGGYGGSGGSNNPAFGGGCYGSIGEPLNLGSGGTHSSDYGGSGGGAVRLSVAGLLTVDGLISARGGSPIYSNAGGGSGGSVWISSQSLAGTGFIRADGGLGSSYGGGGGGGRIAIYYEGSTFVGQVSAQGGTSSSIKGGAGTIYTKPATQDLPDLVIANRDFAGAPTPVDSGIRWRSLSVLTGGVAWMSNINRVQSVRVGDQAIIAHPPGETGFRLVGDEVVIDAGGAIDASGCGHSVGLGPGAGASALGYGGGGGGGYGGNGGDGYAAGAVGGQAYGSLHQPIALGSGGGGPLDLITPTGGAGGGAIQLIVYGRLTVDGRIQSNGTRVTSGGSGGSVHIMAWELAGSGAVMAAGGDAYGDCGGGGGGRVAIYYQQPGDFPMNHVAAPGGQGYRSGQAGTVFLHAWPSTDLDSDGDTDRVDVDVFQACVTGPGISYVDTGSVPECLLNPDDEGFIAADFDRDGDVDQSDFGILQRCVSGEGNLTDPFCLD